MVKRGFLARLYMHSDGVEVMGVDMCVTPLIDTLFGLEHTVWGIFVFSGSG